MEHAHMDKQMIKIHKGVIAKNSTTQLSPRSCTGIEVADSSPVRFDP